MAKLTIQVEVQDYGGEDEEMEVLREIEETVNMVIGLAQLSVGTFVITKIDR